MRVKQQDKQHMCIHAKLLNSDGAGNVCLIQVRINRVSHNTLTSV